ncbi:MAG: hypothetical protein PHD95_04245 [Candidatus ainarchaeum sp.]|nr:hypothetical protein [Candidatus ainarchaeum sp.]
MLVAEKDGITFFLVEKRFGKFEEMTGTVRRVLGSNLGKPTIIVFPEAAMGEVAVSRNETKQWLRTVQTLAKQHGNGYIFLSVLEQVPKKDTVTNTGYLVGPKALNPESGKPMHWSAYSKYILPRFDKSQIRQSQNPKAAFRHWNRRAERKGHKKFLARKVLSFQWSDHVFKFPRITINGKIVELRVCADINAFNHSKADILIVPACGLFPLSGGNRRRMRQALSTKGFAIVNDVGLVFLSKTGAMLQRRRFLGGLKAREIWRRLN